MQRSGAAGSWLGRTGRGVAFVLGLLAVISPDVVADEEAGAEIPLISHNSRSFRIPFNIEPEVRARIKEVKLCVSEDQGTTWRPISHTTPDAKVLTYRAPQDGEYWFAVQTLDDEGRLFPPKTAAIVPKMKVYVDTVSPVVTLTANGRRGSFASVRWEVRDERLDRATFVLEYQSQGASEWRQIPVRKPVPFIGEATWDAGTAEPIRLRAMIRDLSKNTGEASILLPDGTPTNPNLVGEQGASPGEPSPLSSFAASESSPPPFNPRPAASASLGGPARQPRPAADDSPFGEGGSTTAARPSRTPAPNPVAGAKPKLIGVAQLNLQYEVDDGGPDGPATVELFITRDGGRSWSTYGTDPDRKSPFAIDLGEDGVYGLTLVARSAANLGDAPPQPGERPQYLVEVDTTAPTVGFRDIEVGQGEHVGKVAISWFATDPHLAERPVVISYRAEGTTGEWKRMGDAIAATGRPFIWIVPPGAPNRIDLRIDAVDTLGHRAFAETAPGKSILIDRSRPKGRIIGLDPVGSALKAANPGDSSFR